MSTLSFDPSTLPPKAGVVLEAASKVFLEHGFSGATTDMIQREAGVSKATVYAHFPNKEALFAAVIQTTCDAFMRSITDIASQGGPLRERLERLGSAYLKVLMSPWAISLFRVVIAESLRFPDLAHVFYVAGPSVMNQLVARQLDQAVLDGELDVHHIGTAAAGTAFVALLRNDAMIQAATHPATPPSAVQVDQWVRIAVDTFIAAYGLPRSTG